MSLLGLIALFLTTFSYMSDLVIIPTADTLYGYFLMQGIDMAVIDFIMSGSQIFAIIGALLSALMMRNFSKKTIMVVLYAVFSVATISTTIVVDPYFIAVTRAFAGFCFGALFPTGIAFIIEVFRDDEKKVNRYIGFYNGTMGLIGVVITIIAGVLLSIGLAGGPVEGLRFAFFENFINIPILLLLIFTLPRTPAEKNVVFEDAVEDPETGEKAKFPIVKTIALMVSMAVINILFNTMAYHYALYMPANFDIDPSTAALFGSMQGLFGGIAGFLFTFVFKFAKRFTITLAFALLVVGYLLFGFANHSLPLVAMGFIFNGFALGLSVAYFYSYAAAVYQERHTSLMSSLITIGMGIGIFSVTFLTTFFTSLLGFVTFDPIMEMPITDYTSYMPYIAGASLVAAVISLILGIKDNRQGLDLLKGYGPQE